MWISPDRVCQYGSASAQTRSITGRPPAARRARPPTHRARSRPPPGVKNSGSCSSSRADVLGRRQRPPVRGERHAGHTEPPQPVGVLDQLVVQRQRVAARVVAVDDRGDLVDQRVRVAERAEDPAREPRALLLVRDPHVGLHHLRPEAVPVDRLLVDDRPADVVQQDAQQHDVGVGLRVGLDEPRRIAERQAGCARRSCARACTGAPRPRPPRTRSHQRHGPRVAVDPDPLPGLDRGRGRPGPGHRRQPVLAADDRGVAHHPADVRHDGGDRARTPGPRTAP